MDIVENNRLIDVFMDSPGEYISHQGSYEGIVLSQYQPHLYHLDWNLLMDVIDKIENKGFNVRIEDNTTIINHHSKSFKTITAVSENSKRESVWYAILSLIKFLKD